MVPNSLHDIESIRELKYRYCDVCDRAELHEVADLFTEDGICDLGPAFGGRMSSREEIRAGFGAFRDVARPYGTMHMVTNPIIEITGPTTAEGRWYLHEALLVDPSRPSPTMTVGMYHDLYTKLDGAWLFSSSRLEVYWSAPMEGAAHQR